MCNTTKSHQYLAVSTGYPIVLYPHRQLSFEPNLSCAHLPQKLRVFCWGFDLKQLAGITVINLDALDAQRHSTRVHVCECLIYVLAVLASV